MLPTRARELEAAVFLKLLTTRFVNEGKSRWRNLLFCWNSFKFCYCWKRQKKHDYANSLLPGRLIRTKAAYNSTLVLANTEVVCCVCCVSCINPFLLLRTKKKNTHACAQKKCKNVQPQSLSGQTKCSNCMRSWSEVLGKREVAAAKQNAVTEVLAWGLRSTRGRSDLALT